MYATPLLYTLVDLISLKLNIKFYYCYRHLQLPCRNGSKTAQSETNLNNFRQWLINASKWRFSVVFPAIVKILTRLSGETVNLYYHP